MNAVTKSVEAKLTGSNEEILRRALGSIVAMIGNVDHSRGGGENAARLYGSMLNDFRDIGTRALEMTASST